jgi:Cu(I)/Ag(I) efflux system protein CusF
MTLIRALGAATAISIFAMSLPLSAQDGAPASGEVLKVDNYSGKITIKHAPIKSLGLGQATDDFQVKEPMMLNALRPGNKVNFTAERISGQLTISSILPPS